MNRPRAGHLKEPVMMAQFGGGVWWIIPCTVNGTDVPAREAIEHAAKTGRHFSSHNSLLEAAAELLRLRSCGLT
jgi:hypothetical protein